MFNQPHKLEATSADKMSMSEDDGMSSESEYGSVSGRSQVGDLLYRYDAVS